MNLTVEKLTVKGDCIFVNAFEMNWSFILAIFLLTKFVYIAQVNVKSLLSFRNHCNVTLQQSHLKECFSAKSKFQNIKSSANTAFCFTLILPN